MPDVLSGRPIASLGGLQPTDSILVVRAGVFGAPDALVDATWADVLAALLESNGSTQSAIAAAVAAAGAPTKLFGQTVDAATAIRLTADWMAPGALNSLPLPALGGAQEVSGKVVARNVATSALAVFEVGYSIVKAGPNNPPAITNNSVSIAQDQTSTDPTMTSCTLTIGADGYGSAILCNGIAATPIIWTGSLAVITAA